MLRALHTAATGMSAQQMNIDTIANNLANVNTSGFKKQRVDFEDLLYQTVRPAGASTAAGAQSPTGIQIGLGVKPAATYGVFSPGAIQTTGNPLDMAIEGEGFFKILLPDGSSGYTRDGSFKIDGQGRLVTASGYAVEPEILIPADAIEITIGRDGNVAARRGGENEFQELGTLTIARFVNPAGLQRVGQNLYRATPASGEPVEGAPGTNGIGQVSQGTLEFSNVQVVEEMVNLIMAQRAYEVNSRSIQTADDMLAVAKDIKR
ncbi:MAG: flagellar basal-body rod protein FlgG [Armatimonadetes bacterium]|nr:flagellar basal-body rod protein FlgG [Armatimonadota bacterium]